MSYCRFSEGDIYLYGDVDGGFNCAACRLQPLVPTIFTKYEPGSVNERMFGVSQDCEHCHGEFNGCTHCGMHGSLHVNTFDEAIAHVEAHIAAGHDVGDALKELLADKAEGER